MILGSVKHGANSKISFFTCNNFQKSTKCACQNCLLFIKIIWSKSHSRKPNLHPLCMIKLNNYCLSSSLLALLKTEVLPPPCKDFLTIIHRHVGWLLFRNRKQKSMSHFWPKNWSWSRKKFESWLFTREPLYLSEKENSYLQSGCLCKVVQL